jgi:stage II sporulation protein D
MNKDSQVRVATKDPQFRFVGLGFGHGIGMSQYGTKAFAELGYDYQWILKYYYNGVTIIKE